MKKKTRGKNISNPSLEEDYFNKVIGTRIELYRKEKKISQAELARLIEVSRITITHIEAGTVMISIYKIFRLTRALEIPYQKLLKGLR